MKAFMDEAFLLRSETARRLFDACRDTPIFDFHCHLSPKEIYENKPFGDLATLWLGGDHYKWRAMRACGVKERLITGDAAPLEKFKAWAATLPQCIGNPLYHWAHLELQRYFDIRTPLSPQTAGAIWDEANAKLSGGDFTPRALIRRSNVTALCTTDDPVDSLEYHRLLAEDGSFPVRVLPAFRPDKAFKPNDADFRGYIDRLSDVSGICAYSFDGLKEALSARAAFFAQHGCRASDHSFAWLPYRPASGVELETLYQKAMRREVLTPAELEQYQTALLLHLAAEYTRHHIVMELHVGAIRNNSAKMFGSLGADAGFDSVNDLAGAEKAGRLFSDLEERGILPNVVLYTLNPKDNLPLLTMAGNFQSDKVNLQFGSAWWFNDHLPGMRKQLTDLASVGVLGNFIGMVTDSRSFLSYPRHEYFRRVLCDLVGEWVENGEYPADFDSLSELVRGIACENALSYFGLSE